MESVLFMGLNAVRVLSLISLILVFASTIVVMVTNIKAVNAFEANKGSDNSTMLNCDYIEGSTVPNQPAGVFWAVVASLLILFQTIILFLSECTWPMKFFDKYFPVLGTNFGLGPLGIFQALISTQILSHHVDDFTLVSAFFLFAIACINMLLGLIFREKAKSKRSITSWRAESKGVLPTSVDNRPVFVSASPYVVSRSFSQNEKAPTNVYTTFPYPQGQPQPNVVMVHQETTTDAASYKSAEKVGYGFGRQGEKAAGLRGFILQKPEESLPRYVTPSLPSQASLSRSASTVSGSSSFYVPERPNMPPTPRRESTAESEVISSPPTFKSSRTAL
ncbi:hypothetical protein JR316_0003889 [Psilocybe cubensis]|uniref:Uncharacterized protein n=1 Tax=Psilocybe cubensis TaxID=181762 RepID=A0ACB8H9C6_PSICU|nr:hypothetical protein JR316_0003889 [Psilocybe cubensis]KAH9484408.1 hypothetical protein JR316_0003889 [Psilocybe cubensis]